MDYLFDETNTPADVSAEVVGRKAYELVTLASHGAGGAFRVPRFRILAATVCESYHERVGVPPPARHPALPAPDTIAPEIQQHYASFASGASAAVLAAGREIAGTGAVVLRSSIAAAVPADRSMAGVNMNVHGVRLVDDELSRGIATLMAGMWRPYADWYLSRGGGVDSRRAAVMLCELIDIEIAGTAFVLAGRAECEYGRPVIGGRGMPVPSDLGIDLAGGRQRWTAYWRRHGRGERLRDALAELAGHQGMDTPLEVEFGFDADGELYFFQYRAVAALAPAVPCAGMTVRHTVGTVSGQMLSMLDLSRRPEALSTVRDRSEPGAIWAVHQADHRRWDGFALVWALSRAVDAPPARVILCHGDARRRSHLVTAMHEDPLVEFVAQLPTTTVAALRDGVTVAIGSDGLGAVLREVRTRQVPADVP